MTACHQGERGVTPFTWWIIKCIMKGQSTLTFACTLWETLLNRKRSWWRKLHQKIIWRMCLQSHCLDQGSSIAWTWSSLLKSNSLLERAAWWLIVKLTSSRIWSQDGEMLKIALKLWYEGTEQSWHDLLSVSRFSFVVSMFFWVSNRDTIFGMRGTLSG